MSNRKNLPTKLSKFEIENLHGEGGVRSISVIQTAISNLDPESLKAIGNSAAAEALRLEVKSLEQEICHNIAKKDIEQHIDAFNMLEKNGKLTRQTVTTEVKSGAGNMRIESKSGAACFVATAVYQDAQHPDVVLLRDFRDRHLVKTCLGRRFINWYYYRGPSIAIAIENKKVAIIATKWILQCIVQLLRRQLYRLE